MKKLIAIFVTPIVLSVIIMITVQSCKKENDLVNHNGAGGKHSYKDMYYDSPMLVLDEGKAAERANEAIQDLKIRDSITTSDYLADTTTGWCNAFAKENFTDAYKALYNFHSNKLEDINNHRVLFGFTSLQSIADELNSLFVIDSSTAKSMVSSYNKLIVRTQFGFEPITDPLTATILNTDGFVQVGSVISKFENDVIKEITDGKKDNIYLLDTVTVSHSEWNIVVRENRYNKAKSTSDNANLRNGFDLCHQNNTSFYRVTKNAGIMNVDGSQPGYMMIASFIGNPSSGYVHCFSTKLMIAGAVFPFSGSKLEAVYCTGITPHYVPRDFGYNPAPCTILLIETPDLPFDYSMYLSQVTMYVDGQLHIPAPYNLTFKSGENDFTGPSPYYVNYTFTQNCQ